MSDYSRVKDFSVKDALPTGDANKKILGSDVDAELDAVVTSNNTKANKVTSPTSGAYLVQDSNGDLADGSVVISAFADTLLDDADAEAARITLGVQSAAAGSTIVETGTTAQRDGSPVVGYLRGNTDLTRLEWYNGAGWVDAGGLAGAITTRGDLIRGDSSGAAERVALGTDGQFLMSDGTDAVWQTRGPVRATPLATTSGTEFDFTGLPSWVSKITLMLYGVSLTGTDSFLTQLGTGGGMVTSGYASMSTNGAGTDASSTSGFIMKTVSAVNLHKGHVIITRLDSTKWVASHTLSGSTTDSLYGGGSVDLGAELTQLRLTRIGSNTFDAGQITIIYE